MGLAAQLYPAIRKLAVFGPRPGVQIRHAPQSPHLAASASAEQEASAATAAWKSEQAAQNTSLISLNAELWTRHTADQTRIDQLEIENSDLRGRNQKLQSENMEVRDQMEREKGISEGLRGQLGEQGNEVEMMRKEVMELREKIKGLEGTAKKRGRGGDEGRSGTEAKRKKTGNMKEVERV
ncbi:hypothetical protein K491DRAFT_779606 [Lophiostoma macrostomum CBS 122681]|uniref:Uncharacterized protein n=1 Tax=Lophiostoma macrostomum CBS 122681 TaxID=1314788 RepID=A0A6A6T3Q8_9PLEO|nr:hypothetical protein K491DRAFT_779606 [Lophiostoma macrostomum CBS 122681]